MKSFVKTLTLVITMLAAFTCLACKITVNAEDPVICTVTYKSERASAPSAIQVKQNTVLTQSQLPELKSQGYIFMGWFDANTKAEPGKYKVKNDVTLTAGWEIDPNYVEYTVEFNSMGGSSVSSQTIRNGQKATRPADPTKTAIASESYSFENWYTSTDGGQTLSSAPFDFNTAITSNITLYAKWNVNPVTYTVSFNSMGGSTVTSQTVTSGQKVTRPTDPTKDATVSESYSFAGWYTSTDGGTTLSSVAFDFDTLIRAPVTLYAKWNVNPVTYTVSFNSMGGSTVTSQTVTGGQKATRPADPTKTAIASESYSFENWYTSTDGGQTLSSATFDFNTVITSNITLYAKWTVTPIKYTVTFNTMGGSTVASQTVTGGQKATRPSNPTKPSTVSESYSFADWYTSTDGGTTLSSTAFDFNTAITSNITLYAKWTATPITYIVTFNTMGGSTVTSQTIESGFSAYRPSDPTKTTAVQEGYSFENWYTSTDDGQTLSSVPFDFNTIITSNITLYAKWVNSNEIPLTFEFINDGYITINGAWSTLKYSINGGTLIDFTDDHRGEIPANYGDKIRLYAQESENRSTKAMEINCTSDCYIYGNVMSLVTLNPQTGEWNPYETSVQENAFYRLFNKNSHLINHDEEKVYLPATTLSLNCYTCMFYDCTSLTEAPVLPATTLAANCYGSMFSGCTSLTEAPALPATTLVRNCYDSMFSGCTSLTEAPVLPATTLATGCYSRMFASCTSLTKAPDLPAARLFSQCYEYMFHWCTNLNHIECLATNIPNKDCTLNWLDGVSSTGTFIKNKGMTRWTSGASGIPEGWTVRDAQ